RVPARRPPRAARFPSTTLFRSGVPESVTGTPLPLPPGDAAEALATLEFAAVLDRVASHAAGPAGAARVRGRVPTADLAWARHERSEEHTSELQSRENLVCRLLL